MLRGWSLFRRRNLSTIIDRLPLLAPIGSDIFLIFFRMPRVGVRSGLGSLVLLGGECGDWLVLSGCGVIRRPTERSVRSDLCAL